MSRARPRWPPAPFPETTDVPLTSDGRWHAAHPVDSWRPAPPSRRGSPPPEKERADLLRALHDGLERRHEEVAHATAIDVGTSMRIASRIQATLELPDAPDHCQDRAGAGRGLHRVLKLSEVATSSGVGPEMGVKRNQVYSGLIPQRLSQRPLRRLGT